MLRNHVNEALRQVRDLQDKILEKQRFKGYSGRARALGGCMALLGAWLMAAFFPGMGERGVFIGWGVVLVIAFSLNYGAVLYWFLNDPEVNRDHRRLRPAMEVLPFIFAGGALTYALATGGHYAYLYGVWMVIYGLAHRVARDVIPRRIRYVAAYYLLAGAVCLAWPGLSFLDVWVMGAVFFVGEWFGGLVLHMDEKPEGTLRGFFGLPAGGSRRGSVLERLFF